MMIVNWRRIEQGYPAVLALSFFKQVVEPVDPLRTTGEDPSAPASTEV